MDNTAKTLEFLYSSGIINASDVQELMNKKQRHDYLKEKHIYKIWQGKDGRYRTYINDPSVSSGRKMIVKSSKDVLEKFLVTHYQSKENKKDEHTLKSLYPEWIEYKRLHTNAETYIMRIQTDWKTYYENTDIVDIPITKLDKITLDKWAHKLIQDYSMTKTKYYNVTVIMRQALLYAVDSGFIKESPFALVKIDGKRLFQKVKKKPNHTQVFLSEEISTITQMAMDDFHNQTSKYSLSPLAVLFQLQTGLRIGEVCAVQYNDIEYEDYIHIQHMYRRDTKEVVEHTKTESGDRYVFLTNTAKKLIQKAQNFQREHNISCNGFIFSVDDKPLPEHAIAHLYEKYCRNMGIIQKSSHKSRKTYISALIDARVNINTVREMAGHANEKTTLKNYVFDRNTESERIEKFEQALAY